MLVLLLELLPEDLQLLLILENVHNVHTNKSMHLLLLLLRG